MSPLLARMKIPHASPPVRVRGGKGSTLFPLLKLLLPTRRFDAILSRKFGLSDWKP